MNTGAIEKLCQVAGLVYCDADCSCGQSSRLVYRAEDTASWVPGWANAVEPEELYDWMLAARDINADIQRALLDIELPADAKITVMIDEREYRVGRLLCAGCGYFTVGNPPECAAPGGDCAIPWVAREHECRQCGMVLEPRTWCPSCTNSWAWPVEGKE